MWSYTFAIKIHQKIVILFKKLQLAKRQNGIAKKKPAYWTPPKGKRNEEMRGSKRERVDKNSGKRVTG